ncbi:hypothetical protein ElyMa_001177900 [Elysia marginata]|uniref:Uncharacterized protein n=1 Tax=Elysia marginata TaxID=1093978 RepID=A0AAV4I3P3_9GAST|nr:hypothetical protein ElyMa_001177900 [Elysia marginata]
MPSPPLFHSQSGTRCIFDNLDLLQPHPELAPHKKVCVGRQKTASIIDVFCRFNMAPRGPIYAGYVTEAGTQSQPELRHTTRGTSSRGCNVENLSTDASLAVSRDSGMTPRRPRCVSRSSETNLPGADCDLKATTSTDYISL